VGRTGQMPIIRQPLCDQALVSLLAFRRVVLSQPKVTAIDRHNRAVSRPVMAIRGDSQGFAGSDELRAARVILSAYAVTDRFSTQGFSRTVTRRVIGQRPIQHRLV